jgi:hypothetical protein
MVAFVSMAPAVNPSFVLGGFTLAAMGTWIAQARPKIRRLALATVCALLVSGALTVVAAADVPCVRCVFDWFPVICYFVYPC